jgi:hypothetical protein
LLPNLLSLDAPLVAIAWLYIFTRIWKVEFFPWQGYAALYLATWAIYVAGRLLDSLTADGRSELPARHEFHQRHRKGFKIAALVAGLVALVLVVTTFPITIFHYLLLGAVFVGGFFALSLFSPREPGQVPYAKNLIAGCTFAFGTSMVAHVYLHSLEMWDLFGSREFLCFAALCTLNISAIDVWEHSAASSDVEVQAADELALTVPLTVLGAAALWFAYLDHDMYSRPFYYAILTGSALLYALNRARRRFGPHALRVLSDVALLVPLLVFLVLPSP